MIKAIETRYKGYRFRSRLEARWAVFFDALGIEWEYEKEGYDLGEAGLYLPDFWLPKFNTFFEVKGDYPSDGDLAKIESLAVQSDFGILVPIGTIDKHRWLDYNVEIPPILTEIKVSRSCDKFVRSAFMHGDSVFGDDHLDMHCPVCGDNFVHFGKPVYREDVGDFRETEGGAIEISMWCECNHYWDMVIFFHEGNTAITFSDVYQPYETDDLPGYWLSEYDGPKLRKAYDAARAARFEHGERG